MVFTDTDLKRLKELPMQRGSDPCVNSFIRTQMFESLLARLEAAEDVCQATEELIKRAELMCGYKISPGDPPAIIQLKDSELALKAWRKAAGK